MIGKPPLRKWEEYPEITTPPLLFAHKGGEYFGKGNSTETIMKKLRGADVIEVDVRKSKDHLLYCHHGTLLEYALPFLFFNKEFKEIQKKYMAPTVRDISSAMTPYGFKNLFLDIKDTSITLEELQDATPTFEGSIYLGARSLDYLSSLGKLPRLWTKVCTVGPRPLRPEKLAAAGIDIVELFFWEFTNSNISNLRENGIDVALCPMFMPESSYLMLCKDSHWINTYDIPEKVFRKYYYLQEGGFK